MSRSWLQFKLLLLRHTSLALIQKSISELHEKLTSQ